MAEKALSGGKHPASATTSSNPRNPGRDSDKRWSAVSNPSSSDDDETSFGQPQSPSVANTAAAAAAAQSPPPRPMSHASYETAYRIPQDRSSNSLAAVNAPQESSSRSYDAEPAAIPADILKERIPPRDQSPRRTEFLNEVAAPAPVKDDDDEHQRWAPEEHLEDRVEAARRYGQGLQDDQDTTTSSDSAVPPSFSHRSQQVDPPSPADNHSNLATQLYTHAYLVFFSLFGTLARLGVQWLTFYPGAPLVTSVLWANVGGSLVMGFLAEDRRLFREEWGTDSYHSATREKMLEQDEADPSAAKKRHGKVKKTIPLYIGLATGFCGSFTSFSSFQRDVFLALSNNLPTPDNHPYAAGAAPTFTSTVHRNGGYSFMAVLAIMFYTVALSLAALFLGAHIALALSRFVPSIPFRSMRKIMDPIMVFLAFGCWLGAVFLAIWPPDRPAGSSSRGTWANEVWRGEVLFALVFAPLGCLLRYYASLRLNGVSATFPLGTFAVNIFGCAVEAMCYDIQHVPLLSIGGNLVGGGRVGCQVLQGVMDGFCGCLTTVSTWVAELETLKRRHAYFYGLVSLAVALSTMVIIMGSVRWSVGWSETACVTMRTSIT